MSAIVGLATNRPDRSVSPRPAETPAGSAFLIWFVSIGGSLALAALFAAHQATLLRVAVPAVATAIAASLYFRRPIGYIHFTLWTWFVTPFIRRVIDWRFGFEDQSLVLLAPYLVTAIAGLTVLREGRKARGLQLTPYLLCAAGILYGFFVGIIRWELHSSAAESVGSIIYGLFLWLAPLLFGLHLHLRWQSYEAQKSAILNSFKWGVLILGVYGIYQYAAPPAWDCAWLEGLPGGYETNSFGRPFPYEIRVWSTLNSPGTFAAMMLPGLVLLTLTKTKIKPVVAAAGFGAFLLSLVRTGWLAWILAMLLLGISQRSAILRKFLLIFLLLPLCFIPVFFIPQFQQTIEDRVSTMTDLDHDGSLNDRKRMYEVVTSELFKEPSGEGLLNGTTFSVEDMPLDSGLIQTALMLGFIGTALYAAGILTCIAGMVRRRNWREGPTDEFAGACRVIFLAMIAELIGSNVFINFFGCMLWAFYGLWAGSRALAEQASPLALTSRVHLRSLIPNSSVALQSSLQD
ncbi:MAG: O-antigen ligase family protein [Terracidiphilus sp.]|jgi:O-antigen ligase